MCSARASSSGAAFSVASSPSQIQWPGILSAASQLSAPVDLSDDELGLVVSPPPPASAPLVQGPELPHSAQGYWCSQ
eukprot:15477883-Alexandrium_andersonii.AAC.1